MKPLLTLLVLVPLTLPAQEIQLGEKGAQKVGQRIWQNECAGTVDGLTSWNKGEDFASLGIGHFIWYPAGKRGPFHESFPELVRMLERKNVALPKWLTPSTPCPWKSRSDFMADFQSARMVELRSLLKQTIEIQTRFLVQRLEQALPKMLEAAPASERNEIRARFLSVASSPAGVYALIDYVNFKGEGIAPSERYQGQGWGLLQVLEGMQGKDVKSFATSAKQVLSRRVENAPPERNEAKWLPGWKNRINTYISFE